MPDIPQNITVTTLTTEALIKWDKCVGKVDMYHVTYLPHEDNSRGLASSTDEQTSSALAYDSPINQISLSKLTPGTKYKIEVFATSSGQSGERQKSTFTTGTSIRNDSI